MAWITVNIDLDEIYDELSSFDKAELAQWLFDDGLLGTHKNPQIRMVYNERDSFMEEQHKKNLASLWNKYHQMSDDDLKLIEELSKKY